jgi:hypothetical protein
MVVLNKWYFHLSNVCARVNLSLFLTKHHAMGTHSTSHGDALGEWRYSSRHSLTLALDGGEWSALRPGRFISKERAPGTHGIGGWMGPRAGLDGVVKRKIPSPAGIERQSSDRPSTK